MCALPRLTAERIVTISYLYTLVHGLVLYGLSSSSPSPRETYPITATVALIGHILVIVPTVKQIFQRGDLEGYFVDHSIKRCIFLKMLWGCIFAFRFVHRLPFPSPVHQ